MIFETHAHYDDARFDEDREAVLARVKEAGIYPVINVGSTVESISQCLELARTHEDIYAALGVHPSEIDGLNEEVFAWLQEQMGYEKTVAVGEIGLDYYWEKEPGMQARQREWFARQLALAREVGLPVIIHSRDAAEDTLRVMRECQAQEIPGVVHCYSYSPELAHKFVAMGYYIGVGGVVTFQNAKKLVQTVGEIPLERILLETDSPYLAPEPSRGRRNDSTNLSHVIQRISEIRGITPEEVARATEENAYRLFPKVTPKRQ